MALRAGVRDYNWPVADRQVAGGLTCKADIRFEGHELMRPSCGYRDTPVPVRRAAQKAPRIAEQQRALALYREARNAEQNSMISYAVLNYYKIIEIRHPKGPDARDWIAKNFPTVRDDQHDQHGIPEFLAACGQELPERYIYKACRVAVAHASEDYPSDPDDTSELRRLHNAADVLRRLARLFITAELGVSDSAF